MTTEEAIQIIDTALAQVITNREGHKKLEEAIERIKNAVEKSEKK